MNYLSSGFSAFCFRGLPTGAMFRIASSDEYGYIAVGPIYPVGLIPCFLSCFFTVSGNRPRRLPSSTAESPSIRFISAILAYFLKNILVVGELLNKSYPKFGEFWKKIKKIPLLGNLLLTNFPRSGIIIV